MCALFLFPEFENVHLFPKYENKLICNVLAGRDVISFVKQGDLVQEIDNLYLTLE